jgi:hypothetical protein
MMHITSPSSLFSGIHDPKREWLWIFIHYICFFGLWEGYETFHSSTRMRVMGSLSNLQTEGYVWLSAWEHWLLEGALAFPRSVIFDNQRPLAGYLVHSPNATSLLVIKPMEEVLFLNWGTWDNHPLQATRVGGYNNIIWGSPEDWIMD